MRRKERDASKNMIYKAFPVELKADDAGGHTFEGYASVFGVMDLGNDIVMPGAFKKSLGSRNVKLLWQHERHELIGVWESIEEDSKGLKVKGRLIPEVQKGAEAAALLKAGAIDSMSIGFRSIEASYNEDSDTRQLIELDLFEISLVSFPMLPDAMVTNVKAIETDRDFEKFLRDSGFSKSKALAIASRGFKDAKDALRDADAKRVKAEADSNELLAALKTLRGNLNV